jgi:uncharacterized protein Veg
MDKHDTTNLKNIKQEIENVVGGKYKLVKKSAKKRQEDLP